MQAAELEEFYAEQAARMNAPDDGLEDHIARLLSTSTSSSNRKAWKEPQDTSSRAVGSSHLVASNQLADTSKYDNRRLLEKRKQAMADSEAPWKRRKSSSVESDGVSPSSTPILNSGSSGIKPASPQGTVTSRGKSFPMQEESSISARSNPTVWEDLRANSTDDISMFTEPSRISPDAAARVQGPVKSTGQKASANKDCKRVPKKTLQYVQLQGKSSSNLVGETDLVPSSPIEDLSGYSSPPLRAADKPAPPKAGNVQPTIPLQGATKRVSSHAPAIKAEKSMKLDTKEPHTAGVSRAKSSKFRIPSPALSTASSCESEISTGPVAPIAGPSKKNTSKTKVSPTADKSRTKKKPIKLTPYEFALSLQDQGPDGQGTSKGKGKKTQYLEGKVFLYVGTDMNYASESTRGRMKIIVEHGGGLVPAYDASKVTHVVTDATKHHLLRALGMKTWAEVPKKLPIVKWSWVLAGATRKRRSEIQDRTVYEIELDDMYAHCAFPDTVDFYADNRQRWKERNESKANVKKEDKGRGLKQEGTRNEPIVIDQDDTPNEVGAPADVQALAPSTSHAPLRNASVPPDDHSDAVPGSDGDGQEIDPLAEFYALARADRAQQALLLSSGDEGFREDDDDDESDPGTEDERPKAALRRGPARGFTCDRKERQLTTSPNQDVVDKLQELADLHKAKPGKEDQWRAYSYNKCLRALRNYPTRIKSFSEARSIPGVGEKTARKIMEIIETGELRRIAYERTEDVETTRLFQGVYGVGQSTAYKWYANGCRTLQDLKDGKGGVKLSTAQKIGLEYYDDINSRMPREEAKAIFETIKPIVLSIDPDLFVEIMGSYRRGKATCGDIDILITRDDADGKTHAGVLPLLLNKLHKAGIITEHLALPEEDDELEGIYRGLCRLPVPDSRRRRIDFLTVPWRARGAALLYYTGDDIFNRAMRYKAGKMGYSLNQKGLFSGVVRDPRNRQVKTNPGTLVASETEEEIFRILNVPWQEPHERIRG